MFKLSNIFKKPKMPELPKYKVYPANATDRGVYWICYKNGSWVRDILPSGEIQRTGFRNLAMRFYDFDYTMRVLFTQGYSVHRVD